MNNYTGDLALFVDPKMTVEAIEELKATQSGRETLKAIGSLTNRDLVFYSLGKVAGLKTAEASFHSTFASACGLERETQS